MNRSKLLTLQLRPIVNDTLADYVAHVKSRLPENVRAKVTTSLILRKLIARTVQRADTLEWLNVGRQQSPAVQLRVRMTEAEYDALHALAKTTDASIARTMAALIMEAMYPDGNYPANPEHKQPQPTE